MFRHILLPTDGSPVSRRAAIAGVGLAKALGARVTAFYAAPAPTPLIYEHFVPVGYMPADEHVEAIEKAASRFLGAVAEAAKSANVPCESVHLTSEYPADAILATAKRRKCDLIVMASHSRRGVAALFIGSETQKVLAHSPIPVLVYR
jgi:nucleotide-binding universal stress UspA family protein